MVIDTNSDEWIVFSGYWAAKEGALPDPDKDLVKQCWEYWTARVHALPAN
jgi:hypothetical protein